MTQTLSATDEARGASRPTLAEYLERFDREARHSIWDGPRYRVSYSVLGEGPCVYIVQGICGTRRLYAPVAAALSAEFRVVLYDLPGVTTCDRADLRRYRLEDFPEDLVGLADHLGDRRLNLMGFSFGSTIAVRAMDQYSERIARAILVGGFARRTLTRLERLLLGALRWWPGRLCHLPGHVAVSKYNHGPELLVREPALFDFYVDESDGTPIATAAMQALCVDRTDVRETACRIRQPITVIHGEQDRLVPVSKAAELANRLRNVRIMVVPGCGHLPQLSHPELLARVAADLFHRPEEDLVCMETSCPHAISPPPSV